MVSACYLSPKIFTLLFEPHLKNMTVPPPEGMNMTDSDGRFTNPAFKNVPNPPMFSGTSQEITIPILNLTLDVPIPVVATSVEEVRMMEVLGTWMIEHAWDGLVGDDGEVVFEGFRKIFEEN